MDMHYHWISVYLEQRMIDFLEEKSKGWNTTRSAVIRFLIQDYIDDMKRFEEQEKESL